MQLVMQPGTLHSAYVGLRQTSQAFSKHSCACRYMGLLMQPGTFHSAQAFSQHSSSTLMHAVCMRLKTQPGTFHSAYAGLAMLMYAVVDATWHI